MSNRQANGAVWLRVTAGPADRRNMVDRSSPAFAIQREKSRSLPSFVLKYGCLRDESAQRSMAEFTNSCKIVSAFSRSARLHRKGASAASGLNTSAPPAHRESNQSELG